MALPPLQRVDHEVVIILSADGAWDIDRANAEVKAIRDPEVSSPWPTVDDHPWVRYMKGGSRGDLSTVQEYLDESKNPYRFVMRRLTMRELARIDAAPATEALTAIACALTNVDGVDIHFDRGGHPPPHALTDADMQRLRERVGDEGIAELGRQALACSAELLEVEKKP